MELAQRLTQVRGAAAVGLYLHYICSFLFLSFPSVHFSSIAQLSFVSGDEG